MTACDVPLCPHPATDRVRIHLGGVVAEARDLCPRHGGEARRLRALLVDLDGEAAALPETTQHAPARPPRRPPCGVSSAVLRAIRAGHHTTADIMAATGCGARDVSWGLRWLRRHGWVVNLPRQGEAGTTYRTSRQGRRAWYVESVLEVTGW